MNIAFRTDASLAIGTGHVMRCLVLADLFAAEGALCHFVCRAHEGDLVSYIRKRGARVSVLPAATGIISRMAGPDEPVLAHAQWLGAAWQEDARQTAAILHADSETVFDWLVVDHYALDARWQAAVNPDARKLLVIDDLADRDHFCDILLDQTLSTPGDARYRDRVPAHCLCLLGSSYALMRPDFERLRPGSLSRRERPSLKRLLIFLGGADRNDETRKVIAGLKRSSRRWERIDVVVGQNYPARRALEEDLRELDRAVMHVQTPHMAQLMSEADFAITGGGTVTWEKCALGLPSATVTLAQNQAPTVTTMGRAGVLYDLGDAAAMTPDEYAAFLEGLDAAALPEMSRRISALCDGGGARKIAAAMKAMS